MKDWKAENFTFYFVAEIKKNSDTSTLHPDTQQLAGLVHEQLEKNNQRVINFINEQKISEFKISESLTVPIQDSNGNLFFLINHSLFYKEPE